MSLNLKPIEKCPPMGQGVNHFVNKRVIFLLSRGLKASQIMSIVQRDCLHCGRDVTQDIQHSLETAMNIKLTGVNGKKRRSQIELNLPLLARLGSQHSECTLGWWRGQSQQEDISDEDVLLYMFHGVDTLVCVAASKNSCCTHKIGYILEKTKLSEWQYIVPNPMYKQWGKTKSGVPSMRCQDNVGARRYLIIEFDSGTLDEQCIKHRYLSGILVLKLLVYSGGKSIHGWYDCFGLENIYSESWEFMKEAVSIGADPRLWIPCQLTRIPGGTNRITKKKQEIIYCKL